MRTTIEIDERDKILPRITKLAEQTGIIKKRVNTLLMLYGLKLAENDPTLLTRINTEFLTENIIT